MGKKQFIGLVLISIAGIASQFTNVNSNNIGVWILAILAVVGMLLVLSEYFNKNKEE